MIGIEGEVDTAVKGLKSIVIDIINDKCKRIILIENQKKIVNHNGVLNIPNEINRILRS